MNRLSVAGGVLALLTTIVATTVTIDSRYAKSTNDYYRRAVVILQGRTDPWRPPSID